MNLYRIIIRSRWGEPYIVTVPGSSLYEALSCVTLDPGWTLESYSVVGVSL